VLVNTSFNVRGEPIVNTPEDAFKCFMGTELDVLVVGNQFMTKPLQSKANIDEYRDAYELD
jgi:carbamoyltransferase